MIIGKEKLLLENEGPILPKEIPTINSKMADQNSVEPRITPIPNSSYFIYVF
jgi:hypothetical protein